MTSSIVGLPVHRALLDLPWDVPFEDWPTDQLIGLPHDAGPAGPPAGLG